MPQHTVTLPHHGDQFVITDRPAPTLTDRYRPLPDGMNSAHVTVIRAHQVRTGDIVAAFFPDGPGIRRSEHVLGPFNAHPRAHGTCTASCEECEELNAHGASTDRYVCLDPADEREDCVVVFRNTPVAIIANDTAALFPPLDSVPLLPDLFTLDEGEHGPYEALPVSRAWGPWQPISVTRATAEQISTDLPTTHAGRHLTCSWLHDSLLLASDPPHANRARPPRPPHPTRHRRPIPDRWPVAMGTLDGRGPGDPQPGRALTLPCASPSAPVPPPGRANRRSRPVSAAPARHESPTRLVAGLAQLPDMVRPTGRARPAPPRARRPSRSPDHDPS